MPVVAAGRISGHMVGNPSSDEQSEAGTQSAHWLLANEHNEMAANVRKNRTAIEVR